MTSSAGSIWKGISDSVVLQIKLYLLDRYLLDIMAFFGSRMEMMVRKYIRYLPNYVVDSEIDDLRSVTQLELIETIKIWNTETHDEIWPLAQARITGAMKDHIRYITRSDPFRVHDWITDAAYMYMTVNRRADFTTKLETGDELNKAMEVLTERERKIVIAHTRSDLTFKEIGERVGVSESQISRIYKKCIQKLKKKLLKDQV